ncbi:hypothetical protein KAU33_01240 [Candidatus Dependentiae bacterium]|nr:hypothetical protein [Candidatus Dependentiae bacterium]
MRKLIILMFLFLFLFPVVYCVSSDNAEYWAKGECEIYSYDTLLSNKVLIEFIVKHVDGNAPITGYRVKFRVEYVNGEISYHEYKSKDAVSSLIKPGRKRLKTFKFKPVNKEIKDITVDSIEVETSKETEKRYKKEKIFNYISSPIIISVVIYLLFVFHSIFFPPVSDPY